MKQIIVLMSAVLFLAACASQTSTWRNMSESEIASWRKAGVVAEDVDKYVKEDMSAREVLDWKNQGFTKVEDILAWKRGNFTSSEAKEWHDKGFNVTEAKAWVKNKFELTEAARWKNADFTLEQAIKNRAKGLIPNP